MKPEDDIESGWTGAATHGAMVVLAVAEGIGFKSRWAKLLAGACTGWHLYATYYHIKGRVTNGRTKGSSQKY